MLKFLWWAACLITFLRGPCLWPFVVTPPWDSFSTVWQNTGWETSVKVEHCHVNCNFQLERMASHVPLKEDLNDVSQRMWVFKWRRIKGTKSATNPFPTRVSLSTFQYHWFTAPHPHVQRCRASKQTCLRCLLVLAWGFTIKRTVSSWKYCWNTHPSEMMKDRSVCNSREGPRAEKYSWTVVKILQALVFWGAVCYWIQSVSEP